jgi:UDP-glucuronate decarboxylase
MSINDGRVISNFIIQALSDEDLTIYGDGTQTRSFQYIDDLIEGMFRFMKLEDFSGPLNMGNPEEFSLLELAEIIIKLTNSNSQIKFLPSVVDDPKQRCPDISLAEKKLNGWKPKVSLNKGLKLTIDYFKEELANND